MSIARTSEAHGPACGARRVVGIPRACAQTGRCRWRGSAPSISAEIFSRAWQCTPLLRGPRRGLRLHAAHVLAIRRTESSASAFFLLSSAQLFCSRLAFLGGGSQKTSYKKRHISYVCTQAHHSFIFFSDTREAAGEAPGEDSRACCFTSPRLAISDKKGELLDCGHRGGGGDAGCLLVGVEPLRSSTAARLCMAGRRAGADCTLACGARCSGADRGGGDITLPRAVPLPLPPPPSAPLMLPP